ncbi:MAG: aspartate kinase [Chloroflexota bacterium]|nr:aspartate kinase [Chloroflexota bacterium]
MLVMKFGGTSIGSAQGMRAVAEIIQRTWREHPQLAVVVSAMSGVTDQLTDAARAAAEGRMEECEGIQASLLDRHMGVCQELLADADQGQAMRTFIAERMAELERFCQSIAVMGEVTVRGLDMVSAIGEKLSAAILSALLRAQGVPAEWMDASQMLVTDDRFGAANPLLAETRDRLEERVRPLMERGLIPVITGYIGATSEGVPTTLGRGGGDYSAAIIGACLEADEVWIWSDVDGILTADPNLVHEARTLEELSYVEAAELAYFGAEVLHPKTIKPLEERGIPLRILNTFNPDHPGTLIVKKPSAERPRTRAIISTRGLSLLTVQGSDDAWTPQMAARALSCLGRGGVEVLMFTQSFSERNLSLVVRLGDTRSSLRLLRQEFANELDRGLVAPLEGGQEVSTISVVGGPGEDGQGVVPRAFAALGGRGMTVISTVQASSEYNVSFVVPEAEMAATVRLLHRELM